jgi:hypothetical protein
VAETFKEVAQKGYGSAPLFLWLPDKDEGFSISAREYRCVFDYV